jgi:hypothetical protein
MAVEAEAEELRLWRGMGSPTVTVARCEAVVARVRLLYSKGRTDEGDAARARVYADFVAASADRRVRATDACARVLLRLLVPTDGGFNDGMAR